MSGEANQPVVPRTEPMAASSCTSPRGAQACRGFRAPLLLLALAPAACGDSSPAPSSLAFTVTDSAGVEIAENSGSLWTAQSTWSLGSEPTLRIGVVGGAAEYQLHAVRGARRLPDGGIAVANSGSHEIRFYAADGTFRASVGREGEGPGEFLYPQVLDWFTHDTLGVWDPQLARVTLLGTDGTLGGMFRAPDRGDDFLSFHAFMGEGSLALTIAGGVRPETLAAGPLPNHATYQRYHEEEGFDTIGTFFSNENWAGLSPDGSPMITPRPLSPRAVADAALGRFYHGDARSFEIRVFEDDGTPIQVIRGSGTPRPITDEMVSEYMDFAVSRYEDPVRRNEQRDRLAQISFPEQLPAYSELIVAADGHLWLADYRLPWDEQPVWTVFDAEGRELGRIETPVDLDVMEIGQDYLLGTERDELGVEYVVVYPLLKQE